MRLAKVGGLFLVICLAVGGLASCGRRTSDHATLNGQLLRAARDGDTRLVQRLLKSGADIEARDQRGKTALGLAADYGQIETVDLLLKKGADPIAAHLKGEDALIDAARERNLKRFALILRTETDTGSKNKALFAACESEPPVIQLSPAEGEQLLRDQKQRNEPTFPMSTGADMAAMLLEHGASIEARDENGSTPLILAAQFGATGIVKLLLARGASIDARNNHGDTALIAAACNCAIIDMPDTFDSIGLLLSKRAKIDAKGNGGDTALMRAAQSGQSHIVELLLNWGASTNLQDAHGKTALDLAIQNNQQETVQVLRKAKLRKSVH